MPPITAKSQRPRRNNPPPPRGEAYKSGLGQQFLDFTRLDNPHRVMIGAWLIFAGHCFALSLLFRPMSGLIDTNPLVDQDWGLHFHHLRSIEAFWAQDRALTGYSP
ncbi:MAG: hypothetical protein FJ143_01885, partial [Deltaproteobacteria bacterium]|nr:hypothetical protein [Deltaproteobacteria bacterium]